MLRQHGARALSSSPTSVFNSFQMFFCFFFDPFPRSNLFERKSCFEILTDETSDATPAGQTFPLPVLNSVAQLPAVVMKCATMEMTRGKVSIKNESQRRRIVKSPLELIAW